MANITLSIPDKIYEEMKSYKDIRWSEVAREAISSKIDALKYVEKLSKKRKITKTDIKKIGGKLKIIAKKTK